VPSVVCSCPHFDPAPITHRHTTQVYRYEKRDYNDIKYVLKVPHITMPPEYKVGGEGTGAPSQLMVLCTQFTQEQRPCKVARGQQQLAHWLHPLLQTCAAKLAAAEPCQFLVRRASGICCSRRPATCLLLSADAGLGCTCAATTGRMDPGV
jgi:hypothetical protein